MPDSRLQRAVGGIQRRRVGAGNNVWCNGHAFLLGRLLGAFRNLHDTDVLGCRHLVVDGHCAGLRHSELRHTAKRDQRRRVLAVVHDDHLWVVCDLHLRFGLRAVGYCRDHLQRLWRNGGMEHRTHLSACELW